jgi:hypothetical protein
MEKQDLAQMMKQMLARMDDIKEIKEKMEVNQAKSDANRKADKEEMLAEIKADRKN